MHGDYSKGKEIIIEFSMIPRDHFTGTVRTQRRSRIFFSQSGGVTLLAAGALSDENHWGLTEQARSEDDWLVPLRGLDTARKAMRLSVPAGLPPCWRRLCDGAGECGVRPQDGGVYRDGCRWWWHRRGEYRHAAPLRWFQVIGLLPRFLVAKAHEYALKV